MTPFTQFLGRLVELVGAENAAQLTRDFAGQTLQFPITDHYEVTEHDQWGFLVNAPVLGSGFKPQPITHIEAAKRLRYRCQFPEYLQLALQKFQQEKLKNQKLEPLSPDCYCQQLTLSPSAEHQGSLGDEGGK